MFILIIYDVQTTDSAGRRRLRRVARACVDYGVRVQLSVFECNVGRKEYLKLRDRLIKEIDPEIDSLRIYHLDERTRTKTEHYGIGSPRDLESDPLII